MNLSTVRTALVLVPVALFACAGSSQSDDAAQGDDANVKAAHSGGAGAMCGGIAGLRCIGGLRCQVAGNVPDASGTCARDGAAPGEAGGTCGGIAGVGCSAGLRCDLAGKGPDESGICAIDTSAPPPPAQCQAVPACEADEAEVAGCALADDSCVTHSLCGKSIHCKKTVITIEGTLRHASAPGGETTGFAITTSTGLLELVLDESEQAFFADGRFARAKGKPVSLSGVETKDRPALQVSSLLVCPAPGPVDCKPPVSPASTVCADDRAWVARSCSGVTFLD